MALSLGADSVDQVAAELGALLKAKPPTSVKDALKLLGTAFELRHARPKLVKTGACKEVIHKFDAPPSRVQAWPSAPDIAVRPDGSPGPDAGADRPAPTLLDIPVQKCWPLDGGRFITLPCVVTRDPDTGERNVGMYRMQVYDVQTTGMHWQLQKVGARHGRRYYETGTRMPVSVFLGGDPAFPFAATAPLPDGLDEFLLAGWLRKKSVELVKCETNDLEVPANADFVLEGYVDPSEPLREEGPFGDHTGYYSLPEPYPVFHLTAITHRKDAVYPATIVGLPPMEDFYMGSAAVSSVRRCSDDFRQSWTSPCRRRCVPQLVLGISQTYPMQAYKIMHGLWGMGQMMFSKYIVVVDHDVDVHDTSAVLFRWCANTDPQRDSILSRGPADVLDHATSEIAVGGKMGIDATRKLPGEGFKRRWPPVICMDEQVRRRIAASFG